MNYQIIEPFRVKTLKGEIELKAGQTIILPEDKATLLLEQGRIRPVSQNIPIPFDTLKNLYMDTFNRVGWAMGLLARPGVIQAEGRLNQVWLDCMEGKASFEDFKTTLTEWEGVVSGAIKIFPHERTRGRP